LPIFQKVKAILILKIKHFCPVDSTAKGGCSQHYSLIT